MAEFRHVKEALVTPTKCASCSTHSCEKGFVDTLVEHPGYGRIYFCVGCVEQMGRLADMVQAGVHTKLKDDYAELLQTVDRLEGELADAAPVMEAVRRVALAKT